MNGARIALTMGFVVLLFNSGARFSIGLMLYPMVIDLGWSRTTLSSVVTLFMIIAAAALPFTGKLVDRIGAQRILFAGILMSGLALCAMGFITKPWQAFVCYGLVFAIGNGATSVTPVGVLLARWYPDKLGIANSIAISGMGLGQLLIIYVLASQLAEIGWRSSFVWLGIAMMAFTLPLIVFSARRLPSASEKTEETPSIDTDRGSVSLINALKRKPVWILFVIYAICGFQDFLISTHIVALALDEGVNPIVAGHILAFMGLASLTGVLLSGFITDRFGPIWPTAAAFIIRIVLFSLLIATKQPWVIVTAGLAFGFTFLITAPLTVVFARTLFGIALLGTASGLITMVHHASGGLGAVFAARVYDSVHTYQPAIMVMLGLSIAGFLLTLWLKRSHAAL